MNRAGFATIIFCLGLTATVARANSASDLFEAVRNCEKEIDQTTRVACIAPRRGDLVKALKSKDSYYDSKWHFAKSLHEWLETTGAKTDAAFIEERFYAYRGAHAIEQECLNAGDCSGRDQAVVEYFRRLGPEYKDDADKLENLLKREAKHHEDGTGVPGWLSALSQAVDTYNSAHQEQQAQQQQRQAEQQEQQAQQRAALESAQRRQQQQALYQQEMQTLRAQQVAAEQQRAAARARQATSSSQPQAEGPSRANGQNAGSALQVAVEGVPSVSKPYNTDETCDGGTVDLASTTIWRERVRYQISSSKEADVNVLINMSDGKTHNGPTHLRAGTQEISFEYGVSCSVYSPSSRIDVLSIEAVPMN